MGTPVLDFWCINSSVAPQKGLYVLHTLKNKRITQIIISRLSSKPEMSKGSPFTLLGKKKYSSRQETRINIMEKGM